MLLRGCKLTDPLHGWFSVLRLKMMSIGVSYKQVKAEVKTCHRQQYWNTKEKRFTSVYHISKSKIKRSKCLFFLIHFKYSCIMVFPNFVSALRLTTQNISVRHIKGLLHEHGIHQSQQKQPLWSLFLRYFLNIVSLWSISSTLHTVIYPN